MALGHERQPCICHCWQRRSAQIRLENGLMWWGNHWLCRGQTTLICSLNRQKNHEASFLTIIQNQTMWSLLEIGVFRALNRVLNCFESNPLYLHYHEDCFERIFLFYLILVSI